MILEIPLLLFISPNRPSQSQPPHHSFKTMYGPQLQCTLLCITPFSFVFMSCFEYRFVACLSFSILSSLSTMLSFLSSRVSYYNLFSTATQSKQPSSQLEQNYFNSISWKLPQIIRIKTPFVLHINIRSLNKMFDQLQSMI